ncbi:MAG: radical SAM protein [Coriobacteriia bacterium]|nr:MAG: radical SAM protein [Coriobacteriia bacterium]
MDIWERISAFDADENRFERDMEKYGVPFEQGESSPRLVREHFNDACLCHCENGGASVWRQWISRACLACRTGKNTGSVFVDLRCTRNCYFCFNENQPHKDRFKIQKRDIELELKQAHRAGAHYDCLAITGGEPLLNKEQALSFLGLARRLYPDVHLRLYTNGELADKATLEELKECGLNEIRFSVKPDDVADTRNLVLANIERAVSLIDDVVIEMPVMPGTLDEMKALMMQADAMGVRGMNLLEFCFPLHNAEEFRRRGFKLRHRSRKYPHDYWYAGGIPVAGSEKEALELLRFAADEGLRLGVHYCSTDNRNTAQVHFQNKGFYTDAYLRQIYPWYDFDEDGFLKCAKAYGADAEEIRAWLDSVGHVVYGYDPDCPAIAFPRALLDDIRQALPHVVVGESAAILEEREDGSRMVRELNVRKLA